MKVLFDYQIFSMQKYGGISRYYVELMKEYKSLGVDFNLSSFFSNNEYIDEVQPLYKYFDHKVFNKISSIINLKISKNSIVEAEFDIFHPTYYNPYFLKDINKPYVLTIYDFIHEKFAELYPSNDKTILWKKESALNASRIIAISENTKKDIIKYYGIDSDKIDVVYLSSSLKKTTKKLDIKVPKEYILFVGNRGLYKNFKLFIESINSILKENKDLYVVCAGGGEFNYEELKMFNNYDMRGKVLFFNINNEILSYLYQNARMFVFPSIYEGFGIPVVEAFNCDCPVVLSNTSSLPEVGGDAAEYFDPYSKDSIYEVVNNLLNDNNRRSELISLGREQREKFSWETTARKTLDVYKKII